MKTIGRKKKNSNQKNLPEFDAPKINLPPVSQRTPEALPIHINDSKPVKLPYNPIKKTANAFF